MTGYSLPFSQERHKQFHLYALVDGALFEGFYDSLEQVNNLRFKSLLAGTMDAGAASVGPILLELKSDIQEELIKRLLALQEQQPTPIWLSTKFDFIKLFNMLREMLYVEKEDGSQLFFRYYDFDCFPGFLSIVYKNPYYTYSMRKIQWAIWHKDKEHYRYYDQDKQGDIA